MDRDRNTNEKASPWRDDQLIASLKSQVQQLEAQLTDKSNEVDRVKMPLLETQAALDSTREDMALMVESLTKGLEDQKVEHAKQIAAKEGELCDLRTLYMRAIEELMKGVRETLEDLETQLEEAKSKEADVLRQLKEVLKEREVKNKRTEDLEFEVMRKSQELDHVKERLRNSKYANGKLNEEKNLWKKYAEKVEDERKTNQRVYDLEKRVLNKFGQVESFLKSEKQHRNILLNHLNTFGINLTTEFNNLQNHKQTKVVLVFAGTQTDTPENMEDEKRIKNILEEKINMLQEELNRNAIELENALAQNATLRGVILKMKAERENWEREKEHIEEEVRVSKIEDSVKMIKNNFLHSHNGWNAFQEKREVSDMKHKKVCNNITMETPGAKPAVFGRQYFGPPRRMPVSQGELLLKALAR